MIIVSVALVSVYYELLLPVVRSCHAHPPRVWRARERPRPRLAPDAKLRRDLLRARRGNRGHQADRATRHRATGGIQYGLERASMPYAFQSLDGPLSCAIHVTYVAAYFAAPFVVAAAKAFFDRS